MVKRNFRIFEKNLPPNITYEKFYNNEEKWSNQINKQSNNVSNFVNVKTYQLTKTLENNKFLKMVLSKRNETWKKELFEKLEKEDGRVTFDEKTFTVTKSNNRTILTEMEWCKKIDRLITEYFREFHLESIDFDQSSLNEINKLKLKVDDIRKIYLIDYYQTTDSRLFLLGRISHVTDFFDRFPDLKFLSKLEKDEFKETNNTKTNLIKDNILNNNNNEDMINKSFDLPFNFQDSTIKFLMNETINRLKKKYFLFDYSLNIDNNSLELTGLRSYCNELVNLLKNKFKNIKSRKVDLDNIDKILKLENLSSIIKNILLNNESNQKLIYKNQIIMHDNEENIGIFIHYIQDFKEIDSANDSVYEKISECLIENLKCIEYVIDMNHNRCLMTQKWKEFELNSFNVKNISYTTISSLQKHSIILVGKKEHIDSANKKIDDFLVNNSEIAKCIELGEEEVILISYLFIKINSILYNLFNQDFILTTLR
jgi:hypothetical protein